MILDHIVSRTTGSGQFERASELTRRGFIQAGVAAGGGLMLSLRLPLARGEAEAADPTPSSASIATAGLC